MKERPKPESSTKAPYQTPEVVRVSLRPEEAVLGHCKVTGVAGPVSAGCRGVRRCSTQGS